MKKFFTRLSFYLICVLSLWGLLTVLIFSMLEKPVTSYNAAAIDKEARLVTIKSPKIVLIAGSNFAFGMDSAAIEDATGMMVVNLGLHAGLGYQFYTEMAKASINPGDLLVVGFEYDLYDGQVDVESVLHTLEIEPSLAQYLVPQLQLKALMALPEYSFNRAVNTFMGKKLTYTGIYSRASFNGYGDIGVSHPKNIMTNAAYDEMIPIVPENIDASFIAYFKSYHAYVLERGAHVVFTFPSLNEMNLDPNSRVAAFVEALSKIGIPIISDPMDYVFPDELFFDTHYHLNDEGVKIRTQRLITDIQAYLQTN